MNTINNSLNIDKLQTDPYSDIINNLDFYLEKYKDNFYVFSRLPKDVLVDIIRRLMEQNSKLIGKNNILKEELKKKNSSDKMLLNKSISDDLNELFNTTDIYINNLNTRLRQAYCDLINLQERGYIVYE